MVRELKNYIDGNWIESESDIFEEVKNPATNETLAKVPFSTEEEVLQAIDSAKRTFNEEWRNASINDRIDPLFEYVQVLREEKKNIAKVLVKEHGKELSAALGEVDRTIQMVQDACTVMEIGKGDFSENVASAPIDEYSVMRPLGVFTMIPPFNFPAMVPWWFAPYAISVGDTYIIKANEVCPMTQQYMFELIDSKLDLPDGVINLIHGGPEVAEILIEHPDVEGVSFVGSTPVARHIYKLAAEHGKRVQAQAGANNYHVVMPDANLDRAVDNLLGPYWGNSGQRCLAGSVLIGVGEIYDELKSEFVSRSKELKIGYGLDEEVDMGPVVSEKNLNDLKEWIDKGLEEGGKLVLDGRDVSVEGYPDGYFLGPTIFENVEPGMEIFDEEVFGPVMCLYHAENLDEAVNVINRDSYGNATTIYTENGRWARKFQNEVKVGNVGINIGTVAPMSYYPFCGMKDSFFGDLHGQSKDVVNFLADRQVVVRRWFGSE